MDAGTPFSPAGPSFAILASTTTPSGSLVNLTGSYSMLVTNRSSTEGFLAYGPTSTIVASAVVPVVGAPGVQSTGGILPVPGNGQVVFTFAGPTFFGGLTPSGNTILDLTPGSFGTS